MSQSKRMNTDKTSPSIVAHRGASALAPENTLAAFRAGIAAGSDGAEFDVQLAADGVPVVIHDATLKRTAGLNKRVAELTSTELGKIDVGSWFNKRSPKDARSEFVLEGVPTFKQVLDLYTDTTAMLYIELKCDETNYKPLARSVCDILRSHETRCRAVVMSFRLAVIPEVRCQLPPVMTGALFEPSTMLVLRRRKQMIALAREFGAGVIALHHTLATPKLCSLAAEAELPVAVWTVDNPKWLEKSRTRNISTVITNDPAKLLDRRKLLPHG